MVFLIEELVTIIIQKNNLIQIVYKFNFFTTVFDTFISKF